MLLFALAATIRADEVHAELGVTGSGVGVAILDSGVDGTHAGLSYPGKTLQNVKIVADPGELLGTTLPVSSIMAEDLPDTDTTTGHGSHCAIAPATCSTTPAPPAPPWPRPTSPASSP